MAEAIGGLVLALGGVALVPLLCVPVTRAAVTVAAALVAQLLAGAEWGAWVAMGGVAVQVGVLLAAVRVADRATQARSR